jgi:hypothetical protein
MAASRTFIVTYRTPNGGARVETQGYSWLEVRALFSLLSGLIPGTLAVQEVQS